MSIESQFGNSPPVDKIKLIDWLHCNQIQAGLRRYIDMHALERAMVDGELDVDKHG